MTKLALVSTIVGIGVIALRLPGVLLPAKYREFAVKFPRSVLWGRILMGIAAAIAWVVMFRAAAQSDEWRWAKPLVVIGVPVAYWLVWRYGAHYLSLRASSALLLMVAKVMVDTADLSDSPVRLFITVLAYIWVVSAIWMTVAPHHVRDLIGWATAYERRCRNLCAAGVALGVVLVLLGLFVY